MSKDNKKNLSSEFNGFENEEEMDGEDILNTDDGAVKKKKTTKNKTKNTESKNATIKKAARVKTTKQKTTKNSSGKKSANKNSSNNKKTLRAVKGSHKKIEINAIEDELLKVTNIKSIEQVKKPRKVALMMMFYAVIVVAIIVFCLIRFSKPNKNNLLLKESSNYEYLTKESTTSKRTIEESLTELSDDNEILDKLLELTTKSVNLYKSNTEEEETIKEEEIIAKEEALREKEITEKIEESTEKQEISERIEETTKKKVETNLQVATKAWPKREGMKDILPRFKEVIYDYPTYYQMSSDELALIKNSIFESYDVVKDDVFGEGVSFSDKGTNGILYLNYIYLKEFVDSYDSNVEQRYAQLPVTSYYNYIMNDKFNFDYKLYTTNLKMKLDFKNAKNQGLYYEVPATIYEPAGSNVSANGINKLTVRVLNKAKIGYTESFSLTSLLEVLDIECNTKHNPFFDIEDVVGDNPKAIADMKESGFDVRSMIDEEIFNYILFDKKGYITALYLLKS